MSVFCNWGVIRMFSRRRCARLMSLKCLGGDGGEKGCAAVFAAVFAE